MSIIEKQVELGRTLFQINMSTTRSFFEIQRDNVEKYIELNRSYADSLPEVKGVGDFISLQRDYSESLWSGFRESVQVQTDLVKEALEDSGVAVKSAFVSESDAEEVKAEEAVEPVKTAKPKVKAKSAAKVNNTDS